MNINLFAKNTEIGEKVLYLCLCRGWNFVSHLQTLARNKELPHSPALQRHY